MSLTEYEKMKLDKMRAELRAKMEEQKLEHRKEKAELEKRRKAIRDRLRAQDLERRKREFDKMPLKKRKIFEMIGWSPYQADKPVIRYGESFTIKK